MLSEQEILRREAVVRMRELNIEPYPAERFPVSHTAAQIAADGKLTEKAVVVCLAGRLMSRRIMGRLRSLCFAIRQPMYNCI